jgi:hypothetical protein
VSDGTDFGKTQGEPIEQVFTVHNLGTQPLDLSPIGIVGSDFLISSGPASPVAPGGSSDFTVLFLPSGNGIRTAEIFIPNNDTDESPYTFTVQAKRESFTIIPILLLLLSDEQ